MAAGWRAVLLLGRATTSAAARSRHADPDPRCETSFCRYRYRSRRFQNWIWLTWRTPRLWCPLPASLAGGAGARPDHPISGHRDAFADRNLWNVGRGAPLLRRDARELDYLGPLLG